MYSLRYGTPPIVHATGGLADAVVDCNGETLRAGSATGFVYSSATPAALGAALERAVNIWRDRSVWRQLQLHGMTLDFGWAASVRRYRDLYERLSVA
jgi:starch synthase